MSRLELLRVLRSVAADAWPRLMALGDRIDGLPEARSDDGDDANEAHAIANELAGALNAIDALDPGDRWG